MSRFNVGDRVVTRGVEESHNGEAGIIVGLNPNSDLTSGYNVELDKYDHSPMYFAETKLLPEPTEPSPENDTINHPSHYTAYKGIEVIQLTEQLNFNKGNVIKYVARAGLKDKDTELEDLKKAAWYLQREIERISNADD